MPLRRAGTARGPAWALAAASTAPGLLGGQISNTYTTGTRTAARRSKSPRCSADIRMSSLKYFRIPPMLK